MLAQPVRYSSPRLETVQEDMPFVDEGIPLLENTESLLRVDGEPFTEQDEFHAAFQLESGNNRIDLAHFRDRVSRSIIRRRSQKWAKNSFLNSKQRRRSQRNNQYHEKTTAKLWRLLDRYNVRASQGLSSTTNDSKERSLLNNPPSATFVDERFLPKPSLGSPTKETVTIPIKTHHGTLELTGHLDTITSVEQPITEETFTSPFSTYWHPEDFLLGEVIMAPWCAPNFNPNLWLSDRDCAYATSTGTISAKMRPMIIISKLPDGLLTVPVTSFGGKGIASSTQTKRHCLFRLRDSEDDDVFWVSEAAERVLTTVADQEQNLPWDGWRPTPESHVDVSRTWTVECKTPVKRLSARLKTVDLQRLVQAAFQVMEPGVHDLIGEVDWSRDG